MLAKEVGAFGHFCGLDIILVLVFIQTDHKVVLFLSHSIMVTE